ncbi:MAG: hypothetical protein COA73_05955 [Candidatus Hydrogenedentota bacterium]|nr:MAG: hypothetical protein COA73_05955 [Candidatus Hydrogenedentota bacterium]
MKSTILVGFLVSISVLASGCATTPVEHGVLTGGALGAGLGAIIGHQSGRQGEGALIGAGIGAITGALLADERQNQPRYYRVQKVHVPPPPRGHYETRIVHGPHGELYEERIWVQYR